MEDRIVFPAEEVEAAGKRLKRIALTLDDLSDMLRAAEKSIDLNSLKRAAVLDELTRYVRRLNQASEEAERIGKALEKAWDDFVECEETTVRKIRRIQPAPAYDGYSVEKSVYKIPVFSRKLPGR